MTYTKTLFKPLFCCLLSIMVPLAAADAGDWPMWRHDANRSNASPHGLPQDLKPQWTRQYRPLTTTWEDPVNQDRMPFDRVYEPVVAGQTMYLTFNWCDKIAAIDTRTGLEKWTAYADGPVRFAPVVWQGKLYFVSDDGQLYCLNAQTGESLWTFQGAPDNRKILGNRRLISLWPARGGPTLRDGIVYFANGIWPFMGIFIHAVNAETGQRVWTNSGLGAQYMNQPHSGAVSFGGLAPQGALAALDKVLIVPGGRSVPAGLDRQTGQFKYFHLAGTPHHEIAGGPDRKREGGSHVSGLGDIYFNHRGINTTIYNATSGRAYKMFKQTTYPVITQDTFYLSGKVVTAYVLKPEKLEKTVNKKKTVSWNFKKRWARTADASGALIKAGDDLFAGDKGQVSRISLAEPDKLLITWTAKVDGQVARLIAADNRLFAVTLQGHIHAFGADKTQHADLADAKTVESLDDDPSPAEQAMLQSLPLDKGYCLIHDLHDGRLLKTMAQRTDLHVIGLSPNQETVDRLRRRFDAAGLYGDRISIFKGTPLTTALPPYLLLMTSFETQNPQGRDAFFQETFVKKVYHSLRPYGGSAWFPVQDRQKRDALQGFLAKANLPGAEIQEKAGCLVLTRKGALPGAGDWTHQYGDMANTSIAEENLVKLPLGLLWFGGNSHTTVLPRHGHGPSEQVVGGRLIIEGINIMNARDVYTGLPLWQRNFDDLKTFNVYYDKTYKGNPLDTTYNQVHIPGVNARGTNYVSTEDKIYLVKGHECLILDMTDGKTLDTFTLPVKIDPKAKDKPTWGYIGHYEDLLVGSYSPAGVPSNSWHSEVLFVKDRHSGKTLWTLKAAHAFRHNAITAGNGKLFCIDALPDEVLKALKRRGKGGDIKPLLQALDIRTGNILWWNKTEQIFGTWLSYHKDRNVILQSGRASRDMIKWESTDRMTIYDADNGKVVWDKKISHGGPCMLHDDTIYTGTLNSVGKAVNLDSGDVLKRLHPLTGQPMDWQYKRFYGCNYVVGNRHLLTFRSGAAGFYDIENDGGTGNFGGFKSGCTANLISANGVLNAPDYTRTCTCSYQNQTSLAMIHTPDVEVWTFNDFAWDKKPVKRAGLNFGAPGDRRTPDGTLWLDWPSVGGASPDLPVTTNVKNPRTIRKHSLYINSGGLKWVAASAIEDVETLTIQLAPKNAIARIYTVRLFFCELDRAVKPGDRVFSVKLQGRTALSDLDIAAEAGGVHKELVKTVQDIMVDDFLRITLKKATQRGPLLSGIEILLAE